MGYSRSPTEVSEAAKLLGQDAPEANAVHSFCSCIHLFYKFVESVWSFTFPLVLLRKKKRIHNFAAQTGFTEF